ncbi:hypothetical protein B0H10DRAFT_2223321 [Mycena sp. CBHHK59/15]|nr:hypothetical protein B0H10DRAFT_2223321 [Mycena sp. CBHHK59/15]
MVYVVAPVAILFFFSFLSIVVGTYSISTMDGQRPYGGAVFGHWRHRRVIHDDLFCPHKRPRPPPSVSYILVLLLLYARLTAMSLRCHLQPQVKLGSTGITSAFNMALLKLYAISMMRTLNARRTICASHGSHTGRTTPSSEISGGSSRAQRCQGDTELRAIHVLT